MPSTKPGENTLNIFNDQESVLDEIKEIYQNDSNYRDFMERTGFYASTISKANKKSTVYGVTVQRALKDHFDLMKINLYRLMKFCDNEGSILYKLTQESDLSEEELIANILEEFKFTQLNIYRRIERILQIVFEDQLSDKNIEKRLLSLNIKNREILLNFDAKVEGNSKLYFNNIGRYVDKNIKHFKSYGMFQEQKKHLCKLLKYVIIESSKEYLNTIIPIEKTQLIINNKFNQYAQLQQSITVINDLDSSTKIPKIKYFHLVDKQPQIIEIPTNELDNLEENYDIYKIKVTFEYTNGKDFKQYHILRDVGDKTKLDYLSDDNEYNTIHNLAKKDTELNTDNSLVRLSDIKITLVKKLPDNLVDTTTEEIEFLRPNILKNTDTNKHGFGVDETQTGKIDFSQTLLEGPSQVKKKKKKDEEEEIEEEKKDEEEER